MPATSAGSSKIARLLSPSSSCSRILLRSDRSLSLAVAVAQGHPELGSRIAEAGVAAVGLDGDLEAALLRASGPRLV